MQNHQAAQQSPLAYTSSNCYSVHNILCNHFHIFMYKYSNVVSCSYCSFQKVCFQRSLLAPTVTKIAAYSSTILLVPSVENLTHRLLPCCYAIQYSSTGNETSEEATNLHAVQSFIRSYFSSYSRKAQHFIHVDVSCMLVEFGIWTSRLYMLAPNKFHIVLTFIDFIIQEQSTAFIECKFNNL